MKLKVTFKSRHQSMRIILKKLIKSIRGILLNSFHSNICKPGKPLNSHWIISSQLISLELKLLKT